MDSNFKDGSEEKAALHTAFRILTFRDHGKRELLKKLKARGYSHNVALTAVGRCDELGYMDDEKVAAGMVKRLIEKGYGPGYIKQALGKKGIAVPVIEKTVLRGVDVSKETEAAKRAMRKKAPALSRETDRRKKWEKACRFLYSRGFSPDVIRQVVDKK